MTPDSSVAVGKTTSFVIPAVSELAFHSVGSGRVDPGSLAASGSLIVLSLALPYFHRRQYALFTQDAHLNTTPCL